MTMTMTLINFVNSSGQLYSGSVVSYPSKKEKNKCYKIKVSVTIVLVSFLTMFIIVSTLLSGLVVSVDLMSLTTHVA